MADTVALMKQRVLDMAIRGELVEQRPEEGTGENLFHEIQSEIAPTKKYSKTNQVKNIAPFEIPQSWKWVQIKDIIHSISGGGTPDKSIPSYWNGDIPWATVKDISDKDIYLSTTIDNITQEGFDNCSGRMVSKGDIIIVTRMGLGRAVISEINTAINQDLKGVKLPKCLDSMYFLYAYKNLDIVGTGTTVKGIKQTALLNAFISLPPLAEQKRIVSKIEEISAVIDQIGTKKEEALSIIRKMRQTALQDAIMGVLVDQEDEDEPASILYEKIQAEKEKLVKEKKIKKDKPLPNIENDEIPFDIPESWKWVRFNNILDIRDGTHDTPKYHKEGIPLITSKNLKSGDIDFTNIKYISEEDHRKISERSKVDNGDILFAMIGTIGNPVLVNTEAEFSIKNVALFKNYPNKNVETKYILYFLKAIEKQLKEEASGAVQSFLSLTYLRKLLIPLPPVAEQYLIIEKLDEIMAIYDQMEAIFDGSSETNKALKIAE